jgi:hypothetical protein
MKDNAKAALFPFLILMLLVFEVDTCEGLNEVEILLLNRLSLAWVLVVLISACNVLAKASQNVNEATILLFELEEELIVEPGDEAEEVRDAAAVIELGPGEVGDVPGAMVELIKPADGRVETIATDKEVILSSEVTEDRNWDWSEMKLLRELKTAASEDGL